MGDGQFENLIEVTPNAYRCPPFGGCAAIYLTTRDSYLIVGAVVDPDSIDSLRQKISRGETAIEVPRGLIDNLVRW